MPQLLRAFFRLIRWPNLVFIFLTQLLFYYCILLPCFAYGNPGGEYPHKLSPLLFYLLALSSILIAAAGYTINDYFDLNIDRVNKPKRMVVEKVIKRRWTILWHWIFSGIGVLLGFYVSWVLRNPLVGLANVGCVGLLWFYSTTFKRKLLIGNVIISLLTAWVILVLWVCEVRITGDAVYREIISRLFKFAIVYGSFAFIISLVREVVKDIEDMEGDAKYGCRTMPIVWGVNVAKVFAGTWMAVLIGALIIFQFYVLQKAWWPLTLYSAVLLDIPSAWVLRKLYEAQTKAQYHRLSNMIKGIMLAGILSMLMLKLV
ncbi:geranylgeranylglycerol-phosphate geranylgeranyltransferase [Puia dinghuensis]|uniref:Prenyltransferase n=1 Tax=Puia dinghuensis TaxID=1792502 RepID=A0A8J2U7F2_9BACT|nr:geranylgeranylglycerol-phosphate geranylgeranyltransferase [Puia dinghuensis]GGA83706.1 prenyltransferase [Puia dinghuensis]